MAVILNNKQSTAGSPYVFYTVDVEEISGSRTADTVQLKLKTTSHLQYATSTLGTGSGYSLTGYLKVNNTEYSIPIKSGSEAWSGTTNHVAQKTITITGLEPADTTLTGIKFRVVRGTGSTSSAGYLASTSCSNITITIGHDLPSDIEMIMEETNGSLLGIADDVIVENLSQKQLTFTYVLHDLEQGTALNKAGVYNLTNKIEDSQNQFIIDFANITALKDENGKIPLTPFILDTLGGEGLGTQEAYTCIPYTNISITNSTTTAKRNGQTSGKVKLNINGIYYNGQVGNSHQEDANYKPTIKYKFWDVNDPNGEPSTYPYIINGADITTSDGTFNVEDYEIGDDNPLAVNYFDPDNAYRIKVQVQDDFTIAESNEISVPKGIPIWTEYADRVDFIKLTIQKNKILYNNILTAKPENDTTLTTTNVTKIACEEKYSIGDKLSIDDGGIKIGAGVSKVLISGNILFTTGGTSATRKGIQIFMYDASANTTSVIIYNNVEGSTTYVGASLTSNILEVEENDIIYMYAINQNGTGSIVSADYSYLSVEVVE